MADRAQVDDDRTVHLRELFRCRFSQFSTLSFVEADFSRMASGACWY
jgi:hypothetical protein